MRTHLSALLFNFMPLTGQLSRRLAMARNHSGPKVDKIQHLIQSDPSGGWEKCWEKGLTPWDLGQPTPILVHLHQTGALPNGRALIPGCGSGHDVVAIACHERFVVGLDISENAIKQATKMFSSSNSVEYFAFLEADFFTWRPTQLFDVIFDYTFFCAIEPEMRSQWAIRIRDLLKPDGELITLIFPISDHEGGPPYRVSVSEEERRWGGGKGPSINPCCEYLSSCLVVHTQIVPSVL